MWRAGYAPRVVGLVWVGGDGVAPRVEQLSEAAHRLGLPLAEVVVDRPRQVPVAAVDGQGELAGLDLGELPLDEWLV